MNFPKGPSWSKAKPGVEPKRAAFRAMLGTTMPQERASEEVITTWFGGFPNISSHHTIPSDIHLR